MSGYRPGPVVAALLLVVGFLATAAVVQERQHEAALPTQARELSELIRARRSQVERLETEARRLADQVAAAQQDRAAESSRVRRVLAAAADLRASAGLEALAGPGLVVELADSADAPRTRGELTDLSIQQEDLRLVVNALWRAGAEAVSVNGRRITSITAIRQAAGTILVNFDAVSSPYRVSAIGDPEALRDGLESGGVIRQFELWAEIYGLGFEVRPGDRVVMPELEGGRDLEWASPAAGEALSP